MPRQAEMNRLANLEELKARLEDRLETETDGPPF